MKLLERETGLPLDLVVLINSFLYEKLIDANIFNAITLWFKDEENANFGSVISVSGTPQESRT
jgi:hypothetical protein